MRGSEAAIDAGWVGSREWVLDTEPTDGQIQVATRGVRGSRLKWMA